jgi:hypothetical protein
MARSVLRLLNIGMDLYHSILAPEEDRKAEITMTVKIITKYSIFNNPLPGNVGQSTHAIYYNFHTKAM